MRLICPNCDAQYEVADDAIPEEGRDVQCSSCGHAWYQLSPEVLAAQAAEAEVFDAPPREAPRPPEVGLPPEPVAPAAPAMEPAVTEPPLPPQSSGRGLDEGLMAVLREEADREVQARAREENRLETQGELGLDPAPVSAAARRIAQLKGVDPDMALSDTALPEPVVTRPPKGKDLLPDIEEINSTLSPAQTEAGDEGAAERAVTARQKDFRLGFGVMLCLAVGIVVLYLMAPGLAQKVPALAGVLNGYVAFIDSLRLWLDEHMRGIVKTLQG